MIGKRIGYIRVSSVDQNTDRQLDGIQVDKTFTDKASGKNSNRPQLELMLQFVREGDTLVVHSMDRLARNLDDLRRIVQSLTAKGVAVQFVKENQTFSGDDSPMANLLLSMMGAFAEFERALIKERQREGIALAVKAGKYKGVVGRKKALSPADLEEVKAMVAKGMKKTEIAEHFGVQRNVIYTYLKSEICLT